MTASSAVALYQGHRGHSSFILLKCLLGPQEVQKKPAHAHSPAFISSLWALGRKLHWKDQETQVTSVFWTWVSLLLCGWGKREGCCLSVTHLSLPLAGASCTGYLLFCHLDPPVQLCGWLVLNQAPPAWFSWQNVHLLSHASQPGSGLKERKSLVRK